MAGSMEKSDFKKSIKSYSAPRGEFEIIEVPPLQYLMIDGHGDPNDSPAFKTAITTLYPLAYKLKFMSKQTLGKDYTVMPLEALWWADDMASFTTARDKSQWDFTLMIMQPDWITGDMVTAAKQAVLAKNPELNVAKVRFETVNEGTAAQTLHVGSFDDEAPVLARMHNDFIPSNGYEMALKHHEIYLSDFRKVEPAKLKTILRQPVRKP